MLNYENNMFIHSINEILQNNTQFVKHTILLVDDDDDNLQMMKRTLKEKYNIVTARNGIEGLRALEQYGDNISIIVSDHKMPEMEGLDFLEMANKMHPAIIKIIVTAFADIENLTQAVNKCNLFQYVVKPFTPDELRDIVTRGVDRFNLMSSKSSMMVDLKELFYKTIKSISSALDAKDPYTHGHSLRVTLYSLILAKELKLKDSLLEEIETAGLLHDIGKIGIPQRVLCKQGPLDDEEFEIMKTHSTNSEKLVAGIKKLKGIAPWLKFHHERWDGRGYPSRLEGENIPLAARIIAIADTYDAMTSTRPYRKALGHEIAMEEIKKCAGSQFDPDLANTFFQLSFLIKSAKENPDRYYPKYSFLQKEINSVIEQTSTL